MVLVEVGSCSQRPLVGNVTQIIEALGQGDKQASADLLPILYKELRQLASGMQEIPLRKATGESTCNE